MKLHIITAALPPRLDGIGDYTALLAAELAGQAEVSILSGEGPHARPIPGVRIIPIFLPAAPASVRALLAHARAERPDWLLLQYNPFAYGKWGLNPHLPLVLSAIRRQVPQTRLAVMMHEAYVPVINWKFAVMTTWQRWQLWSLARTANVGFCSIDTWVKQFQPWFAGKPLLHLPVGSNICRLEISRQDARARLGIAPETIVVGQFGAAHISRLQGLVRDTMEAICREGHDGLLLYIGPSTQEVSVALGNLPLRADGPLPADEVSRRFAAMDIYLAPFVDGVSTRRGSLMAGLQHGIATVGTRGVWTDTLWAEQDGRALLLADALNPEAFRTQAMRLVDDVSLRQRLGLEARQLYEREFTWKTISARLLTALEITSPTAPFINQGRPESSSSRQGEGRGKVQ